MFTEVSAQLPGLSSESDQASCKTNSQQAGLLGCRQGVGFRQVVGQSSVFIYELALVPLYNSGQSILAAQDSHGKGSTAGWKGTQKSCLWSLDLIFQASQHQIILFAHHWP